MGIVQLTKKLLFAAAALLLFGTAHAQISTGTTAHFDSWTLTFETDISCDVVNFYDNVFECINVTGNNYSTSIEVVSGSSRINVSLYYLKNREWVNITAINNSAGTTANMTVGVFNTADEVKVYHSGTENTTLGALAPNASGYVNFTWRFDGIKNFELKNATVDNTPNNPPSGGGGGGGGSPKVAAFKNRTTVITNETMANVIKELGLESEQFCSMERGMAAVFAVTGGRNGGYPAPESEVSSVLKKPVLDIGGDVYETSASEVLKAWKASRTVVIARGDLEVDSMAAIAYAKANNVPLLLTKPHELPSETFGAVNGLGASNFIIIGGESAVGSAVESRLVAIGSVERIAGETRYETAAEVAKALGDVGTIVIADGERPSTDAAIIAAGYNAPVLYVTGDTVPQSTKDFVKAHKKTKRGEDVKLVFADVSGYILTHRLEEDFS